MSREICPEPIRWLEERVKEAVLTPESRISCTWDSGGIWVDLDESFYDDGSVAVYTCLFAEPADETPSTEEIWKDAMAVAQYMSEKLNITIHIEKQT